MKLNTNNVNDFMETINQCRGPVYLTNGEVDKEGNYNLCLNLKSAISMHLGIAKLLSEHGDWFEIHTTNKNDETILMNFIARLNMNETLGKGELK